MKRFLCIAAEPKDGTWCGECPHLLPSTDGCFLFGTLDIVDRAKRHHHCKHAENLMLDKTMKVREIALREAERAAAAEGEK